MFPSATITVHKGEQRAREKIIEWKKLTRRAAAKKTAQAEDVVVLRAPLNMGKLDITEYLRKIYNVEAKAVNSVAVQGKRKWR